MRIADWGLRIDGSGIGDWEWGLVIGRGLQQGNRSALVQGACPFVDHVPDLCVSSAALST